jgi:hypothetical protein
MTLLWIIHGSYVPVSEKGKAEKSLAANKIYANNKIETMNLSLVAFIFGSLQHVSLANGVSLTLQM